MALANYETLTQALLQAPSSPVPLIATATLDTYINAARNQVAADAECIRVPATLTLASATASYGFSAITVSATPGAGNVIAVRSLQLGGQPLDFRNWEWFAQYYLGNGLTGTPIRVAQQGQGANGTLVFNPAPSAAMTVALDVVCLPIPLVNDGTIEAIPQLWTDAIPFYAAWLGMQSTQRQSDADKMLERYQSLIRRGRQFATPTELPDNLPGGMGAQAASTHQPLGVQPQASR
jgi:hypothetical protein